MAPHPPSSDSSARQGRAPPNQDVSTCHSKRQPPSRLANMAARRASPSSDSSSQSGMADNETEPEPSEPSPPQTAAPPKKKRTRTLTTPHQSAVLHSLLAKSRFPTTAMREEVGRQIGLSARKVQIWFQNQRQKARRPQGESGPLTRPPQFGPFPITTTTAPSPSTGGPSSARSVGSLDSDPSLSGPGIPGWSPSSHQRRHSSAEERDPTRRPVSPKAPLGSPRHHHHPARSSDGISARGSPGSPRSLAPQPASRGTHVESSPHFSTVLPPIILSPLEPRSSIEPCVSATSPFPPPSSRNFVNTVQRRDPSARLATERGCSPVSLGIPPPFALQPQPQWDPHTFAPFTRPEFASWSQPSRSAGSSFSAFGAHDDPPPRGRHFYTSSGDPRRSGLPDSPLPHHIISPSRGERHSTSASSPRASASGHRHARSDDPVGEA